jgi:recombination protein RecT
MSEALPPQTAVQKRQAGPVDIVRAHLESPGFLEQVKLAMPRGEDGKRLVRGAITAMQKNPKVGECSQTSIFTSLLTCAQLGLQLDGREAHLVPFWEKDAGQGKGGYVCQLIPDYKGLVRLVLQSEAVSFIHADVVREHDDFEYDRGQILRHKIDFKKSRGEIYAVYAFVKFKDGGEKAEVMSREDVELIRNGSPGKDAKAWRNNWGEMAKKTVFKRLTKWTPLSAPASEAVLLDNQVEGTRGFVDVDDPDMPTNDAAELPKRTELAPRTANATVVDAGSPAQPPATPPPAKPKGLPRRAAAAPAPAPAAPPPPPAQKAEDVPFIVGWMNEHKIMVPELQQALNEYGHDIVIDNVLKIPAEQMEFIQQNADALADAIKGARVV